jgi:hypothetical protein
MTALSSGTGRYGPWADGISLEERVARFRELHALALLILGQRHPLVARLRDASIDSGVAEAAWGEMHALPTRLQRRLLCTYARLRDAPR